MTRRRERPLAVNEEPMISVGIEDLDQILPPTTLCHPKALATGYAVLVVTRNGMPQRRVYMSLHSATRALDRADKRGVSGALVLVELVPVPGRPAYVVGGEDR